MAGSWTPVREDLFDHPKVLTIAERTTLDPDHVVGKLARLWLWVGSHTTNGLIENTTCARIDTIVAHKGFGLAMQEVGWVDESGGALRFPRWNEHNSNCAKKRQLGARRAARKRNADALQPSRRAGTKSAPTAQQSTGQQSAGTVIAKNSAALPSEASATGDACTLLETIGMERGAVRHLMSQPWITDGLVHYACARLHNECLRARRKDREPIDNPAGFVRSIIEARKVPEKWLAAWNKARLSAQKLKLNGEHLNGRAAG